MDEITFYPYLYMENDIGILFVDHDHSLSGQASSFQILFVVLPCIGII